jgi:hypothetical protein
LIFFPPFFGGLPSSMLRMFHHVENGSHKKKKRVLGFKFLGFLGDGFGVKEKKKRQARAELCPTVTGTP